jgi:hypothetical protein
LVGNAALVGEPDADDNATSLRADVTSTFLDGRRYRVQIRMGAVWHDDLGGGRTYIESLVCETLLTDLRQEVEETRIIVGE